LGLVAVVAALAAWAGTANATGVSIVADPTCCTFLPGPYEQSLGETAIFDNSGTTSYHDVTSTRKGPDGKPLFAVALTPGGKSAPIRGTEYLTPGTYPFYCTLHGAAMSGELTVDGSGTVVRRPQIKVSFVKQKLKQIRKSGVKVKVKAVTASKGVSVTASKGKLKLGSRTGLSLKAGQTKTVTLRLTKAGRKALKKTRVARIKLKATVPFGKSASASRRVR
jgi:plastocyanin